MQGISRTGGQQTSVKIYNAVYSSVQVYECMVRGIAVMRRRADSYVNATQILKVAGVDKGRRTKVLEKEILPGKHEIVQGGYGKYQGTWIPLERGRELASQYGIAPLLSPLFDFVPNQQAMTGLPSSLPVLSMANGPRPLSAAASYPNVTGSGSYAPAAGNQLGPAPIMPGSALRLLNQGRAQGLFTPSTTSLLSWPGPLGGAGNNYYPGLLPGFSQASPSGGSSTLKRTRTDSELEIGKIANGRGAAGSLDKTRKSPSRETATVDNTRPPSSAPSDNHLNDPDEPSPTKRARTDPLQSSSRAATLSDSRATRQSSDSQGQTSQSHANGQSHPIPAVAMLASGRVNGARPVDRSIRLSIKPSYPKNGDKLEVLKNPKRTAIMAAICQGDDPPVILSHIKDASFDPSRDSTTQNVDWDIIIDDMGHTPLHLAASLACLQTVKSLIMEGADIFRGNYQGETPLIRAVLSTHNYDRQSYHELLELLSPSLRTIDTAKRSILHHATLTAGVKGRAPYARYYLEGSLSWIAQHESADFRSIVDLQDEHGDTALNIAARVGNRSLVRALLDVGANKLVPNKLGLRPGDFGVETEELAGGPKAEDLLSSLRSGASVPAQKSQDVIADLTAMIQKLSSDFAVEIKSKQDAFDVTQAHLRAATRELADQRKQITRWQQECSELDQVSQRVRNIEKAMLEEDELDWTGRMEANGEAAGPSFTYRGAQSTLSSLGPMEMSMSMDSEPTMPETDTLASLIKLRRMKIFQDRIVQILEERVKGLQGASAVKEYQCKKIVALCTGIAIDKVEDMLENLVIAVESESQIIDIGRVSGFMQKVKEGAI